MRARRRLVRALLLATGAAVLAPAAHAAGPITVKAVDTNAYPEIRVTVVAPPQQGTPRLTENGRTVAALEAANLGRDKSVVLAVDRSQSMRGGSLRDATAAARTFVAEKARDDRIEVLAFGHTVYKLDGFSSEPADSDSALTGMTADSRAGTALWDTVVRASQALAKDVSPGHVIVLLTDGQDVSSSATLSDAIRAAEHARAAVYAIGIDSRGFTPGPLRELAAATGGRFVEARSTTQLTAIYHSITESLARTWQLRYLTAARPGEQLHLAVSLPGGASATRTYALPSGPTAAPARPSLLPASDWRSPTSVVVVAAATGLLVLTALLILFATSGADRLTARLEPHLGRQRSGARRTARPNRPPLLRRFFASTEAAFANVKQFRALQRLLTRADLPLLGAELLYLCVGVAVVAGMFAAFAGAPALLILLIMAVAGAAPIGWVAMKARTRMKAFDNQLPELLITIAATLKAGHSFRHGIQAVVDEGTEPAAKEFRRVLTETRLGRPMDDALSEMADRIDSKNLSFVLNAVTIQRQIGGSLAGLFEMVAETVRQRQQFARKIHALTAMGRMSAYVLVGLPVLLALALTAMNSTYMKPLWHTSTGHELIFVALAMIATGAVILKKIVSFKG